MCNSVGLPGPAHGPEAERGWFLGADTQTQGVVLLVVLVQGPQDSLLGADRLQSLGSSHRTVKFLQLVFISLCFLLKGFQTLGHVILAGGTLAAEVRDEACKSPRKPQPSARIQNLGPNAADFQPTTWYFFLGQQRCIFPKAINTSSAAVPTVTGPSQGHNE